MKNNFKVKKVVKKAVLFGVVFSCLSFIISCEEDFTDIGSNVITNTKFDTDFVEYAITLENSPLERVKSDNISRQLGQYLLGVYNNSEYEKLEASIVSQVGVLTGLKVVDKTYGSDTIVVTKIDTAFIKLPYQVTLNQSSNVYEIDSVFGDPTKAFNLNVFRSNTYINQFNPLDPSKRNSFNSDDNFEKIGSELNATLNYQFIPNKNDTLMIVKRRGSDDSVKKTDTISFPASTASAVLAPFARIPLDEDQIKTIFVDKFESSEFASQEAFNDYLRGIILEATGNEGSLISFNFDNTNSVLRPSIEIYYSNSVIKSSTNVIDTVLHKNYSFPLSGFRVNTYKMDDRTYPSNGEVKVQGAAGSEGKVQLLSQNEINNLRSKEWLINDATITFYINQSTDTSNVPSRLYLYKYFNLGSSAITSQIKDAFSEPSTNGISGFLQRDDSGKMESYTFNITDYISDVVSGKITSNPEMRLKSANPTDVPSAIRPDSTFVNYSWNTKAVTLFNHLNSSKKPVLRISYSEKK